MNKLDELLNLAKDAIKNIDWHALGRIMAEIDKAENNPRVNGAESIRLLKYFHDPEISKTKVPLDKWIDYTLGYGKGASLSHDDIQKDLLFTKKVTENILKKQKTASLNLYDKCTLFYRIVKCE